MWKKQIYIPMKTVISLSVLSEVFSNLEPLLASKSESVSEWNIDLLLPPPQKSKTNFIKPLAFSFIFLYTILRCDMIAMKREVAARKWQVFRRANVKL